VIRRQALVATSGKWLVVGLGLRLSQVTERGHSHLLEGVWRIDGIRSRAALASTEAEDDSCEHFAAAAGIERCARSGAQRSELGVLKAALACATRLPEA
jgi:hypothetical protein